MDAGVLKVGPKGVRIGATFSGGRVVFVDLEPEPPDLAIKVWTRERGATKLHGWPTPFTRDFFTRREEALLQAGIDELGRWPYKGNDLGNAVEAMIFLLDAASGDPIEDDDSAAA